MNYIGTGLSLVTRGLETGMDLPDLTSVLNTDTLGGDTGTYDPGTIPSAPTITSATAGDTQVTLTIDAADAADVVYARYRYLQSDGTWTAWSAENALFKRTGDGNIVQTGLTNGLLHQMACYAKSGNLTSDWSAPVLVTPSALNGVPVTPEVAVRSVLLADAAVTNLIAQRIFAQQAGHGETFPLVIMNRITSNYLEDIDSVDNEGLATATLQLDCYGKGHAESKQVANAVRSALNAYSGIVTVGGQSLTIRRARLTGEIDGFDNPKDGKGDGVCRVIQDFEIWYFNL